jgi:Gly-Xaa carboxypeptidase
MSLITKLSLVSGAVALVANPLGQVPLGGASSPLTSVSDSVSSHLACSLPPAIDPSGDGLPSADDLFSSDEALAKQVERHQAIVRVPSISYDDLGEPEEDPRWAPFFDLHKVLEKTYPIVYVTMMRSSLSHFQSRC